MNHKVNHEKRYEALALLQDGQEKLLEAIELLKDANRILEDRHAEAYVLDHLEILASRNHGFVSRDYNVEEWIEDVEDDGNFESYEEEDAEEDPPVEGEVWTDADLEEEQIEP